MILLSDDHAQNLINKKSIEVQVVVSGVGTSIV